MVNRMKRHIHYLEYLYCHLLVIFLLGRVGFILNNRVVEHLSLVDAAGALWRGFVGHDLMVAAFLLAVPWLVGLMAVRGWVKRLRAWLAPYYVLMGCTVATIIVADAVMYEYWQFKLGRPMSSVPATTSIAPVSLIGLLTDANETVPFPPALESLMMILPAPPTVPVKLMASPFGSSVVPTAVSVNVTVRLSVMPVAPV